MNLTKALLTLAVVAGSAFAHAEATCQQKVDANANAPTAQDLTGKRLAETSGQATKQQAPAPADTTPANSAR